MAWIFQVIEVNIHIGIPVRAHMFMEQAYGMADLMNNGTGGSSIA